MFSKPFIFSALLLAGAIIGLAWWMRAHRPALDLAPRVSAVRWIPVDLGGSSLAGAWRLEAADRRIGGLSALAIDSGRLLAMSDSGIVAWLPFPPGEGTAVVRALPAAAGDAPTKKERDSEGLARSGDGWWVSFENRHRLVHYDPAFGGVLGQLPIVMRGLSPNRGVEAIVAGPDGLRLWAESSGVSDAARLPDGRTALLRRSLGIRGFSSSVVVGRRQMALPLGPLDNAEGIAAQRRPDGTIRLWVVTDNDQERWRRTLLVALDLPVDR